MTTLIASQNLIFLDKIESQATIRFLYLKGKCLLMIYAEMSIVFGDNSNVVAIEPTVMVKIYIEDDS